MDNSEPDAVAPKTLVSPLIQTDQQHCVGFCYRDRVYHMAYHTRRGWLGSRVVSVLNSGAEGLGSNRSRVTVLGKLFTPIVPQFTKQRNW